MATKKKEDSEVLDINVELNLKTITIPIKSCSPLIMSAFDPKSRQEMIDRAPSKAKQVNKNVEEPEEQYKNSINYLSDKKRYGMPAGAFKAAMVRAAQVAFNMQLVKTRTLFHVLADDTATNMVEIHGTPRMRTDMVRIGTINKVASPRYRAEFPEWSAVLKIEYLDGAINEKQLVAIVNAAGFCCGVGEWRPEKAASGSFGMFRVVSD